MAWYDGVKNFLVGEEAEKYKADPNASSLQGGYGAIANAQNELSGAQNRGFQHVRGQQLNTEQYGQVRGQQQGLASMLTDAAQGKGPSGAGLAAAAQRDASLTQAAALQAGRRGQSAVGGAKLAHKAAMMGGQQAAQNEAIGRANEMAGARGQLGGVLSGIAGQDLQVAGQNAGFAQQANLANQSAHLQNRQQNDAYTLGQQGQLLGAAGQEMAARQQQEQMAYGNLDPGSQGLLSPGNIAALGGAAITAISDENAKYGIHSAGAGQPVQQLMGIGQRIAPRGRAGAGDWGDALGKLISTTLLTKAMESKDKKKKEEEDRKAKEEIRQKVLEELAATDRAKGTVGDNDDPPLPPTAPYAVSDEDAKEEKRDARDMLGKLKAYTYEYKPEAKAMGQPPGRQIGVMAQDLEKSEAGREMVGKDPVSGFKTVDFLKGLPTMMAGLADIEERLKKLEGRKA